MLFIVGTGAADASETWSLATGNPSGVYYPLGGGLASIWTRYLPGLNVKAEVTAASVTNLIQVAKHESEAAFVQGDALASAVEGTGKFPFPLPIAVLARLYPNLLHLITVRGTGIRSVQDLHGRRVSVGAPGSGSAVTTWNVLHALGVSERDFQARQLNFTETANALKDGTIDAGFITGGIGTAAVVELAVSRPIELVAFSDGDMERIRAAVPAYSAFTIPVGTYRGVDEPIQTPSLWNLLVVHADMAPALAYRLLETLFEHRRELELISKVARYIQPGSAWQVHPLPLHPGAERYYRAIGVLRDLP